MLHFQLCYTVYSIVVKDFKMGGKYFANLLLGVLIADKMLDNYLQIYMSFFQHGSLYQSQLALVSS